MIVKRGRTSQVVPVQALNTLSGGGKTGLLYSSTGLICYYKRELAASETAVTLATMTSGTWASGGFVESDATHDAGGYEFGVPNAAIDNSDASTWVKITFSGIAGAYFPPLRIDLVAYDPQDAVRQGLTALPNANAEAAGGLFTRGTNAGQINQDANGRIDVNFKALIGTVLTESVGGYLAAGLKKLLDVATPIFTLASVNQTGDSYPIVNNGTYGNSALLTAINNINNLSALANLFGPSTLVRPASGSIAYPFTYIVKNEEGNPIDVDSNTVTLTAKNAAGTDRSANLSAVTHSGTGEYTFTYTVHSTDTDEGLAITAAGTVLSVSRKAYASADIADADSLAALAAIQAQTDKLTFHGSNILADVKEWIDATPNALSSGRVDVTVGAYPGNTAQSGDSFLRLGLPAGASISADIAEIEAETDGIAAIPTNPLLANDGRLPGSGVIAKQGDQMDLVNAPNATAINAFITAILAITTAAVTGAGTWAKYILDTLAAIVAKTNTIGAISVTVTSPAVSGKDIAIFEGDDYQTAEGRSIPWVDNSGKWATYSIASVAFYLGQTAVGTCTYNGTDTITLVLTNAQTAALNKTSYQYKVKATNANGHVETLATGNMIIS